MLLCLPGSSSRNFGLEGPTSDWESEAGVTRHTYARGPVVMELGCVDLEPKQTQV